MDNNQEGGHILIEDQGSVVRKQEPPQVEYQINEHQVTREVWEAFHL